MDVDAILTEAVRRYLAADTDLVTMAMVSDEYIHLVPALPDESPASRLMVTIEHCFALMDDGLMTEDDLRRELRTELAMISVQAPTETPAQSAA